MTLKLQSHTLSFESSPEAEWLTLPLWGEARLEHRGQPITVRRKSLVLLYHLALEGPTNREELAELLWDSPDTITNLRVELHDLRQRLQEFGVNAFPRGQNPLVLPDRISLSATRNEGEPLSGLECGLDRISPGFDHWLEMQRRKLAEPIQYQSMYERQIAALVRRIRAPLVLILNGLPGCDPVEFGRGFARALGLPFLEGLSGPGKSVKFLNAPYPTGALESILKNRDGVFVIARPAFGEMPRLLLEIDDRLPEGRVLEFNLQPQTWREVREGALRHEPFQVAAHQYLFSQGNPSHLRELMKFREAEGADSSENDLIPRFRARMQLESRYLSMDARLALEHLSVQPGHIPDHLIHALGAESFVEELERRGWLRFDGGWRFVSESVRHVLYEGTKLGFRARTHQRAAASFESHNQLVASAYHRHSACETVHWAAVLEQATPTQRLAMGGWLRNTGQAPSMMFSQTGLDASPQVLTTTVGEEWALLEAARFGHGLTHEHGHLQLVCASYQLERCGISYVAFEEPALIHVRGRAYLEHFLGVGISGEAMPLRINLGGSQVLLAPTHTGVMVDGNLVLPIKDRFDYWLKLPAHAPLQINSWLERGIIELELRAYRPGPTSGLTHGETHATVEVFEPATTTWISDIA
jgi:hypothetical protein